MIELKEGDRDELICNQCEDLRECEYRYGSVEFEGEIIPDVFCVRCLTCGDLVGTHARSGYRFHKAFRKALSRTTITVPVEMQDHIANTLSDSGSNWSHTELFLRALLVTCHEDPDSIAKMLVEVNSEILSRPCTARLNFSLGERLVETLDKIQEASGIKNTSELVRRLILLTTGTIKQRFERELKNLALAVA